MEYPNFEFDIIQRSSSSMARLGRLQTPHGMVETPAFIFCGTKANVKGVLPDQLRATDTQIVLSNTYHLMLQPGASRIAKWGGLHRFMGWNGPILTDSGGYQVFSMGHGCVSQEIKGKRQLQETPSLLKITEEGAVFRSYIDGSYQTLTPESSIEIQHQLGPDLVVMFDECTAYHDSRDYTAKSMERTHRWAIRNMVAFEQYHNETQALYGVIQGGVFEDLRVQAAEYMADLPIFGLAVGGCLGATKDQMTEVVGWVMNRLGPQQSKPVHLLGIGGLQDILNGVEMGIDTFDCVSPTRNARHGVALMDPKWGTKGKINLRNACYRDDQDPIELDCHCPVCAQFSRGYIHHLFKAHEMLGLTLISIHNIAVMNRWMLHIRQAIQQGIFEKWAYQQKLLLS